MLLNFFIGASSLLSIYHIYNDYSFQMKQLNNISEEEWNKYLMLTNRNDSYTRTNELTNSAPDIVTIGIIKGFRDLLPYGLVKSIFKE